MTSPVSYFTFKEGFPSAVLFAHSKQGFTYVWGRAWYPLLLCMFGPTVAHFPNFLGLTNVFTCLAFTWILYLVIAFSEYSDILRRVANSKMSASHFTTDVPPEVAQEVNADFTKHGVQFQIKSTSDSE